MSFWDKLCEWIPFCKSFQSRYSKAEVENIEERIREAAKDADKLADKLESITDKAKEQRRNPLQMLGHDIRKAEFRRRIQAGDV